MKLTQREKTVLDRVCQGAATKEIAHEMGISEQAVKAHIGRLFEKFGVTNRAGLATAASEVGVARRQVVSDKYHERARSLGRENTRLRSKIAGLESGPSGPRAPSRARARTSRSPSRRRPTR